VQIEPYSDDVGGTICGKIIYQAVQSDDSVLDPEVFKFDTANRILTVYTQSSSKAGVVFVKIRGKLVSSGRTNAAIFNITLEDPCSKTVITASVI
jgi:hypothetical protein